MNEKQKVLVAMSGGVDSSVAAYLLKEQGYEITGVTLKLWGGDQDSGCCSLSDVEDARRVASQLDIPHFIFSYTEEFDKNVVDYYVKSYEMGKTPNPCIECNRKIKFSMLHERAMAMGFDYVATGHYAQIKKEDENYFLLRGIDKNKDQSYVIHMANQEILSQTLLPIGSMTKAKVRELANKYNLRTANKAESMDVCFIKKGSRDIFLQDRLQIVKKGDIVSKSGEKLGEHSGLHNFTLGQRRGSAVSVGKRAYVIEKDLYSGDVVLGEKEDLKVNKFSASNVVWINKEIPKVNSKVFIQIRAHQEPYCGKIISITKNSFEVELEVPQNKVASGQSIVLYSDEICLGGGIA